MATEELREQTLRYLRLAAAMQAGLPHEWADRLEGENADAINADARRLKKQLDAMPAPQRRRSTSCRLPRPNQWSGNNGIRNRIPRGNPQERKRNDRRCDRRTIPCLPSPVILGTSCASPKKPRASLHRCRTLVVKRTSFGAILVARERRELAS
jgi:hypothetical protein